MLPNWEYLSKVAEESGETNAIYSKDGTMQSDGKYHLAFSNTVLTEVVLPDDTPYLGNWFIEANNIEKIELPDSITEYKGGIYSLKNLKYLKVSAGVPVINMHFTSCPKVETLIIPEGVTSIQGVNFPAFGGETANGMNVFLPNTLTSFGGCFNSSKIKYLYIPGSVTDLTDFNYRFRRNCFRRRNRKNPNIFSDFWGIKENYHSLYDERNWGRSFLWRKFKRSHMGKLQRKTW